jgi:hypothetical protein
MLISLRQQEGSGWPRQLHRRAHGADGLRVHLRDRRGRSRRSRDRQREALQVVTLGFPSRRPSTCNGRSWRLLSRSEIARTPKGRVMTRRYRWRADRQQAAVMALIRQARVLSRVSLPSTVGASPLRLHGHISSDRAGRSPTGSCLASMAKPTCCAMRHREGSPSSLRAVSEPSLRPALDSRVRHSRATCGVARRLTPGHRELRSTDQRRRWP